MSCLWEQTGKTPRRCWSHRESPEIWNLEPPGTSTLQRWGTCAEQSIQRCNPEFGGFELADWVKGIAVNQRPAFPSQLLLLDFSLTVVLWFYFDVPICAWWIIVCFADKLWESSVFWWPSMQIGDIWVLEITRIAPLHLPSCSVSKLTN